MTSEGRLLRLEREARLWRIAAIVAVVALAIAAAPGTKDGKFGKLEVSRLVVSDPAHPNAWISLDIRGGEPLLMLSQNEKGVAGLSVSKNGEPTILLSQREEILALTSHSLRIEKSGRDTMKLANKESGGAMLILYDGRGKPVWLEPLTD
jgi:hypothetical protein